MLNFSTPINATKAIDGPSPDQIEARIYLDSTDWYIIRNLETGAPVPADVSVKRASARLILNAII